MTNARSCGSQINNILPFVNVALMHKTVEAYLDSFRDTRRDRVEDFDQQPTTGRTYILLIGPRQNH